MRYKDRYHKKDSMYLTELHKQYKAGKLSKDDKREAEALFNSPKGNINYGITADVAEKRRVKREARERRKSMQNS